MTDFFDKIDFAYPRMFWLLCLIPLLIIWYSWRNRKNNATLTISSVRLLAGIRPNGRVRSRHLLFVLRLLTISLLIVCLARPQSRNSWSDIQNKGIDIMIVLDVSSSMLAKDFNPNRLEVAKHVGQDFIDQRPLDRLGLVIFGTESYTQCPLTTDHGILKNLFEKVNINFDNGGTSIGMGLATGINRLKKSSAKSKVIILLTDGVNNAGSIAPLTAADFASQYKIKVYTIGIGTIGRALSPVMIYPGGIQYDYADVEIDEKVMKSIAEKTGGKYFRATDAEKLRSIYKEIDQLEKTDFDDKNYTNRTEEYLPFALVAAALFIVEFILKHTLFRSFT